MLTRSRWQPILEIAKKYDYFRVAGGTAFAFLLLNLLIGIVREDVLKRPMRWGQGEETRENAAQASFSFPFPSNSSSLRCHHPHLS